MIFALAGNQNCGKTTLFNVLTGSNQHVGNFPGVTVDQKIGVIKGTNSKCDVVDLPGIYSLRPYTQEEIVTRDFIINEKPDAIINIVDATNIERNLYLTLQLLELQVPTVLALNMMDELRANGGTIDVEKISEALGIPVVPISAVKNEGVAELIDHAVEVARGKVLPQVTDFCEAGSPVHRAIHAVIHLIQDHADRLGIPARFCATKLIEGDSHMDDELGLDQNEKELLEHIIVQMEDESGLDRNAALADMRYRFIESVVAGTVVHAHVSKEHLRSIRMDKILTGKYTAIPVFIGVMILVFWLTFSVIGQAHDLQRHRPGPVGPAGGLDRRPGGHGLRRPAGVWHQPRRPQPHQGRHLLGRRNGHLVPAHYRDPVLLPVRPRRYGLHGPRGLRHGPPAA